MESGIALTPSSFEWDITKMWNLGAPGWLDWLSVYLQLMS